MFQWQTNGSMSMAKSSNIAAVWILKSERGGAIAGPLGVQDPASTIERHTERGWEPETWAHRQGMGRACICDWSPRPQGAWSAQHTAAEDMASTRLRGGIEEEWGSWQSSQRSNPLVLLLASSCRWREASVFATLCWFQLTVQSCVPLECLKTNILCSLPNQHDNQLVNSELYFEHVDAQVCKDTWLNHSERCTKGCKSPLEFCIWCNVAPKNRCCFWIWMVKSIYMW